MSNTIIKCAVYENNDSWGGGVWIIPKEYHEDILNNLKHDYKVGKCVGFFDFDINYLYLCTSKRTLKNKEYWDNTWCV